MNNVDHVSQNIENEINSNDVILFMKGTPVFPMYGFSARVIEILSKVGVKFGSVNVLESELQAKDQSINDLKNEMNIKDQQIAALRKELQTSLKNELEDSNEETSNSVAIESIKIENDELQKEINKTNISSLIFIN